MSLYSCLPRRQKKQIPESSKHEGASQWLNLSSPVIFPTKKKILNLAVKFYGMKFCMKFLRTAVSGCLRPRPRELCPSSERRTRGAVLCTQQHRRWLHSAPQRRVGPVRSLWSSHQSDQAAAARQSCRGNARTLTSSS